MEQTFLINEYFGWMCQHIDYDKIHNPIHYQKLLMHLYSIDFTYSIEKDANRASDGINLRYRFGYDNDISDEVIEDTLDTKPCSVLEMMVALALRCEEHIMSDPDYGDRTGLWFWTMIDSLGLSRITDRIYTKNSKTKDFVDNRIYDFLNREYAPNGEGGLFTLQNPENDLRDVEIWYQMTWYLTENFDFSI